jgi:putative DNA primase/helicase
LLIGRKESLPMDKSKERRSAPFDFLQTLRPGGPWVLTAIVPDKGTNTITVQTADAVEAFVHERDGRCNIYYSVNPTRQMMNKKAAKVDIAAVEYALADLDPNDDESSEAAKARYLHQLNQTFEPKPTAIVDSGNGIQCLWRLRQPITFGAPIKGVDGKLAFSAEDKTKITDVERRIAAIMMRLNAKPGTQNIDRILRLPGTTNLPNAKKLKAGRVPCPARVISFNDVSYPIEAFPLPDASKPKKSSTPDDDGGEHAPANNVSLPPHLAMMLHVPTSSSGQRCGEYVSRSEAVFAFITLALRAGVDDDNIVNALLDKQYIGKALYSHCHEQSESPTTYVRRQIEQAINDAKPAAAPGSKKLIRVISGQRHIATDQTERALLAAQCPVFVRANSLVEPGWRWEKTAEANRDTLVCRFVKLNVPRLSYMVAKHAAEYQKFDVRFDKWRAVDPPKLVLEQLLDLAHWNFPTVKGIINAPTLRPDGSLLLGAGYDATTQLWYKPSGDITLPPISEQPTKEQALAALKLLKDLLSGFPFVNGGVSVALAGLMTPVLRGAFEFAPLFLFTSPESGTGKSYLVWVIGVLATGRPPAATLLGSADKQEIEKCLAAAAFEAKPILHLNNLDFDLKSATLCQMVTEGLVEIRPFGRNDATITCDCRGTTVYANGNNIRIVGDLVRRTLKAHMNAKMEAPETRAFKFDPVESIKSDRGKYLAAVFTIVRAYMAAGCPRVEAKAFNGYDGWSRMVRYPLIWLGEEDPVKSTEESRKDDPQREALRLRIEALAQAFKNNSFTAADVHANNHSSLLPAFSRNDGRPPSVKAMGWQRTHDLHRPQGGRWITRVEDNSHDGHRYKVETAQDAQEWMPF